MTISIVSALSMGVMCLWMLNGGKLASTRRMALIPMMSCFLEIMCAGCLSALTFPLLTILLVALRLTILCCCFGKMRADAVAVRRQAARRRAKKLAEAKAAAGESAAHRGLYVLPHCA